MPSKKLVVLCDGTWNGLNMRHRTNVSQLAEAVAPYSADGQTPQIVFYDEGVGTASGVGGVTDRLLQVRGGAVGAGLDARIEAAYRFLVANYQPEDEIYVFGFSRGAYTARSLCGLIRKCGILERRHLNRSPEAMRLYRNGKHPRDPQLVDFRQAYAHARASGREDQNRIASVMRDDATPQGRPKARRQNAHADPTKAIIPASEEAYRLMYLGVWDTVGSLGLPERFWLISRWRNRRYRFHDTDASSLIASLRHAVAIDEPRRAFGATEVSNIDALNLAWAERRGLSLEPGDKGHVPYEDRPYQQRWFPGDHGAVGGGNPEPGLSSLALLWIAEGAERAGLNLDRRPGGVLHRAGELGNACAEWRINKDGSPRPPNARDGLGVIGGYRPRRGPGRREEVAAPAFERWRRDPAYRPANLSVLRGLNAEDDDT
jgi:uncharacterized protein (DUF2235 family)